jgi:enolase
MPIKIKTVKGREILDSRGIPTLECIILLDNNSEIKASVPAGTSVGKHEAFELRDNNQSRFLGKGVLNAISNLENKIAPLLIGKTPNIIVMDQIILDIDNTDQKTILGANTTLAASLAILRAQADIESIELYQLINNLFIQEKPQIPMCMYNILNGGLHADNGITFQEFMVMPQTNSIKQSLQISTLIYHTLKNILKEKNLGATTGEEGGFSPYLKNSPEETEIYALELITQAINNAGFNTQNVTICLDIAATYFYNTKTNIYTLSQKNLNNKELVTFYNQLVEKYNITSIEDGMSEDDWYGWQLSTELFGKRIQLVGDDIFVTNTTKIEKGIARKVANAAIIKPNQIGTVTETIKAINLCKSNNYNTIISHRSGETNDSFIADLAVGCNAGQFKSGAPARGERIAKYNRLCEIEEILSK